MEESSCSGNSEIPEAKSSMSLLSSDSQASLISFNRSPAGVSCGAPTGETPMRWQACKAEFHFDSNSTPSKGSIAPYENPTHKLMRKRRIMRNTLSGAKPRLRSTLSESTSKLDLLDDRNLTSFPIPPPVEIQEKHSKYPVNEIKIRVHADNRRISFNPKSPSSVENSSEHPIVLVEDYISQDLPRHKSSKKMVSVSDLKTKICKRNDSKLPIKLRNYRKLSTTSSLTLTPHLCNDDSFANMGMIDESTEEENVERESATTGSTVVPALEHILEYVMKSNKSEGQDEYLQASGIAQKIKQCVICEKSLYEISSLIEGKDYREIVCGSCTVKYEETAKLLEDYEFETSCDSVDDTRNFSIDSSDFMEEPEVVVENTSKRLKTNQFSSHLINRLHLQLQDNQSEDYSFHHHPKIVDSSTMVWFLEAKRKLRWKWRVSGLLPQFLAGKRNIA
ncbi:LAFE_0B11892g1_1 [Lachancea fermentati]|uniref:LAFE_0B11892g1_1 n=1 Tax=Lachancea fermentati TaxID=4955 RepID=A0A1G4M8S8_LACFM|nr:LAFE_0B11892g1_1 [Lachancea fermentati]